MINDLNNTVSKHEQWRRDIVDDLISELEISNGDAQGIVEANEFLLSQEWGRGSNPPVFQKK